MRVPFTVTRGAIVAATLLLLWRVIHVNAALYGDDGRPLPRFPAPGVAGEPAAQASAAAAALRDNAAEVGALLVIAAAHERAGDLRQAERAYESARRIAPIDRDVLQAAAAFELRHGRLARGLADLDRLAEHYPETRDRIFPLLAQMLSAGPSAAALHALAASGAGWMGPFIEACCARGVDPGALAPLLMKRVSAGKAQPAEAACVTERLRLAGRWDAAYQVWLNTLPRDRLADVGFVFNGSFEHAPSGVGFDWMSTRSTQRESGHAVEYPLTSGAAGKRALLVTYNGKRQTSPAIRQYLALVPGRYELSGLARLDALHSVRGLQWTLRCAQAEGHAAAFGVSERFLGSGEWRRFAFEVVVPVSCPGQVLQLEPVGLDEGTTYLAGKAWFDDLRLAHAR